ncbi:methyltransferase [Agaribacter marinus]|uniref:Ribosomal RNA large subunit methyltransferase G n=1 Tax=Agaribacter marinus TaxID=1431249 RepID=A0AA37SZH7_9ALTE|nr:methyltransferase [Agaribacter marinus]GLR71214.1 ribosomal RNA large subunit methyltransferase G [Agaribacter marinus]
MSNTELLINDTPLSLHRFPASRDKSLQAWDASDEFIIRHIEEQDLYSKLGNLAIINDEFGALTCFYADYSPQVVSDSWLSHCAIRQNLSRNEKNNDINISDALAMEELKRPLSAVLIKVPRTLAMLEHQLIALQTLVNEDTLFIAAGKVKSITNTVLSLVSKHLGEPKTSLAKKKARLIFCNIDATKSSEMPYPSTVSDPSIPFDLINHANVFCREHLDIGARMLLKHLPSGSNSIYPNLYGSDDEISHPSQKKSVIDLGCGNGVIGIQYLLNNKDDEVLFIDESFMAIASAKAGAEKAGVSARAQFIVSDCFSELSANDINAYDLILCNPPFHQQNTITDDIAWRMFSQAQKYLKLNGELRVVANRHLDYVNKFKRLFGGATVVGNNKKFIVLSAQKMR